MDDNLFGYIERLELLAFFSGFPLVYALALIAAGSKNERSEFRERIFRMLPYAYALTGTLYLGMVFRNTYPNIDLATIFTGSGQSWIRIWGVTSILFWVRALAKIPVISLLHSFVFFYFIVRDLASYVFKSDVDKHLIKNDMKVYGDSVLVNLAALVLVVTFSTLYIGIRRSGTSRKR